VQALLEQGGGVVLTMGKGGTGKTTIASALAVALADAGRTVHLTTTDPAAHLADTIKGCVPGVRVSRIDPKHEIAKYTAEVLAESSQALDAQGIALLEEDLRSPCTEEIAVFRAFAGIVASRDADFVVLDTAPTGHTLLLLDAAETYHREVSRKLSGAPDAVRELLPRLRDPQSTRVLLITLPEATPVHEAARLQDDLRRAGIGTFAWVVNQSFELTSSSDALLRHKAVAEAPFLDEVATKFATRMAVVPWVPAEPIGVDRLRDLAHCAKAAQL
jgi:arsenite-transporting ATPase